MMGDNRCEMVFLTAGSTRFPYHWLWLGWSAAFCWIFWLFSRQIHYRGRSEELRCEEKTGLSLFALHEYMVYSVIGII